MARIAAATGLDPVEVRRRNLIDEFPWTGASTRPLRPTGMPASSASLRSPSSAPPVMSVSIRPGATELTVTHLRWPMDGRGLVEILGD